MRREEEEEDDDEDPRPRLLRWYPILEDLPAANPPLPAAVAAVFGSGEKALSP